MSDLKPIYDLKLNFHKNGTGNFRITEWDGKFPVSIEDGTTGNFRVVTKPTPRPVIYYSVQQEVKTIWNTKRWKTLRSKNLNSHTDQVIIQSNILAYQIRKIADDQFKSFIREKRLKKLLE